MSRRLRSDRSLRRQHLNAGGQDLILPSDIQELLAEDGVLDDRGLSVEARGFPAISLNAS
jgi:hypothetical protein